MPPFGPLPLVVAASDAAAKQRSPTVNTAASSMFESPSVAAARRKTRPRSLWAGMLGEGGPTSSADASRGESPNDGHQPMHPMGEGLVHDGSDQTARQLRRHSTMTGVDIERVMQAVKLDGSSSPILSRGPQRIGPPLVSGVAIDEKGFSCSPMQGSKIRKIPFEQCQPLPIHRPIGAQDVRFQERLIIEDLLSIFVGAEGNYIDMFEEDGEKLKNGMMDTQLAPIQEAGLRGERLRRISFKIDDTLRTLLCSNMIDMINTLDPSLQNLAARILPIACDHTLVRSFIDVRSKYEYGLVNHALCAAMRFILREFATLCVQLEHEAHHDSTFSLNKFFVHTTRCAPILDALARLCDALVDASTSAEHDVVDESVMQDDYAVGVNRGLKMPAPVMKRKDGVGKRENFVMDVAKGGGVLSIIAERMSQLSGGATTRKLYVYLMERASQPYFNMMQTWVRQGQLEDPYFEFLVRAYGASKPGIADVLDEYWEKRYQIREGLIPTFLEPVKDKILLAGKYLNVLRECSTDVKSTPLVQEDKNESEEEGEEGTRLDARVLAVARSEVIKAIRAEEFLFSIDEAYREANRKLLDVFINDQQLMPRLRSMKRYFLLDQADFLVHFMDAAETDLMKPYAHVEIDKVQSLFELVLRNPASVSAHDPYKDALRLIVQRAGARYADQIVKLSKTSGLVADDGMSQAISGMTRAPVPSSGQTDRGDAATDIVERPSSPIGSVASTSSGEAKGYETLILDYSVPFPLSLVISRNAIVKYQLMFRHLLLIKWTERMLCKAWLQQSKDKLWRRMDDSAGWAARMLALRTRMLLFVQQLSAYIAVDVIESRWHDLESKITKSATADELIERHLYFIDACLEGALLTRGNALKMVTSTLTTCLKWATYAKGYSEKLRPQAHRKTIEVAPGFIQQRESYYLHFENRFDKLLLQLYRELDKHSRAESPVLACLMVRLQSLKESADAITTARIELREHAKGTLLPPHSAGSTITRDQ